MLQYRVADRVVVLREIQTAAMSLVDGIRDFAKNVELLLQGGCVADPYRPRPFVSRQPGYFPFRQAPLAADPIHDLDLCRYSGDCAQQPIAPGLCLVVVSKVHECK